MSQTPGPRQLVDVADDYSRALDQLERRATRNTVAMLRRSLANVLLDLKRHYASYVDELGPQGFDPARNPIRRPGAYSAAEATAKFRAIVLDAQRFMAEEELRQWTASYERDLREAGRLGGELGQRLMTMVGRPPGEVPFTGADPLAIRAAAATTSAYIQGETARFRDQLVQIVGEGATRGWGPNRLETSIRQALRGAKDPNGITQRLGLEQRAALIARSELANAYTQGTLNRSREQGYSYVRVLASNDERTCPTCAARNGRVYPIDRVPVPWHPRCRCVVVPVPDEAVQERDPESRATLLDNDRWQEEHNRGVEAYAEGRHRERLDGLRRQRDRLKDPDLIDAMDARILKLEQQGPDMVKARLELSQALRTPTASEKRLYPRNPRPLGESVPLFGDGEPPAGPVPVASPGPRSPQGPPMIERVGRMKTSEISADPARFQYKIGANSETGEVGSLRGVQKWNEDLAGVLSVWKDPANGKTYVINGHNRLALADKLGATEVPVLNIEARTAAEARAIGAKQNIANGDGTAIDAAKFMRDTGQRAKDMLAQGLNLKGSVARNGAALADLPDFMFSAAVDGRLSIEHGAAIGRSGLTQGQMADAYKVLQGKPSMSAATLDEVLQAARASKARVREESTLFGTSQVETSTMIERAELAAKLRAEQNREIRVLDKAAGKADVLAAKGNRIDVQQAQIKAAEARSRADVFDLLKNQPGSSIARAMNDAAAAVQDAPNRSARAQATKDGNALVNAAIDREVARMAGSSKGLLRSVADLKAKRAGQLAEPPELELAARPADLTLSRLPTRLLDPATAKAGSIGSLRPDQIRADAERFQYKAATDARTGEVGSLEGVRRYDPALAGVISVWKDPASGQTYVINGHNRLAAAKRLGADAVSVRYINAADAAEARAMGALANIAEGQGTAIDAAKFMREKNYTAADMQAMGIPLKKAAARDGANLASLPDDLWSAVVNETISIEKASQIGGAGLDAQGMRNVASVLAKRPTASADVVRELVAAEKASMQQGATLELFNDPDAERFKLSRADVTRAMRDELLQDKSLFKTLSTSRAEQALRGAGSELDTAANRAASAEVERVLAVFDQMKNLSSPVSQALDRGARAVMNANSAQERQQIQQQLRGEISDAVREVLSVVPGAPPPPPPEAPGQSSLFG
jgi:SPP1 gp7 family putative phage head morphogenesis protein